MRQRGERSERSFAHLYDTGGMRRTHLRGHTNILKRLLIHAGGFILGLIMRQQTGLGTPRGLQGRRTAAFAMPLALVNLAQRLVAAITASCRVIATMMCGWFPRPTVVVVNSAAATTCTTGC
jgi:transposase